MLGKRLEPEIGNVETRGGGLGTYIGDVNIGGGAGSETDMAIWGMFILWGGWGSFGTDIGCVNIVGGRGPGAEFGDVNIWGVCVAGLGQMSGMLILWGQGSGMGGWGTDVGDVNMGGWGQKWVCSYHGGGGVLGQTFHIGDVNILRGRGPWVEIGNVITVRRWKWVLG